MNLNAANRPRAGWSWLTLGFAAILLTACGGGGGGGEAPIAPAPPPPAPPPAAAPELVLLAGQANGPGNLDGQGAAARFAVPLGVTGDGAGGAYVADSSNHSVRHVSASGTVRTVAGGGGNGGLEGGFFADGLGAAAGFKTPFGLARRADGSLLVSDHRNHAIRRVMPDGTVTTVAGAGGILGNDDGPGTSARLSFPSQMVAGPSGDAYFIDTGNRSVRRLSVAGNVVTLAGNLSLSNAGQDGPGRTALFSRPLALAVNAQETTVVVADAGYPDATQSTLRTVALDFTNYTVQTQLVLDAKGDPAQFGVITALAFDSTGTLLVAADAGQRILRVNTATWVAQAWTGLLDDGPRGNAAQDGPPSQARFHARGLAAGDAGAIWLTDGAHALRKVSTNGSVSTVAGNPVVVWARADGQAGAAAFVNWGEGGGDYLTGGLSADTAGNLWLADSTAIRRIDTTGNVTTAAGSPAPYVDGFADGPAATARFGATGDTAVDGAGNVYVADSSNHRIRKISPQGEVSTLAGTGVAGFNDGPGATALFDRPSGLAVDAGGTVYVADSSNHVVRKITPSGEVLTLAGKSKTSGSDDSINGQGSTARFYIPADVALDDKGNLYVADARNRLVRKISPTGNVTTLAGAAEMPGAADGAGGTARFESPSRMAIDAAGNVFVVDGDSRVRKVTPQGVVSTVLGQAGKRGTLTGALPVTLGGVAGVAVLPGGQLAIKSEAGVFVTRNASF